MPRRYSTSVRRQIIARLRSGEPVAPFRSTPGFVRRPCSGGNTKP